eukprot:scaffold2696_cov333-Pavlova_lutheri.AAC.1
MAQSKDIEPDFQQQECILGLGLGFTDSAITEGPQANNAASARHCIMNQPRRLLALAVRTSMQLDGTSSSESHQRAQGLILVYTIVPRTLSLLVLLQIMRHQAYLPAVVHSAQLGLALLTW